MRKRIAILVMSISLVFTAVGSAITPTTNSMKYNKESVKLSLKVSKLKEKYQLKYKDDRDLHETCWLICQHSKFSNFNKYEVASIVLLESRYNQFAYNKESGAKGLGQLLRVKQDYKELLPWLNDEYNKNQNVLATVLILEDKLKTYKHKHTAFIRYNGRVCNQSVEYAKNVEKVKRELEKI